ncbi:MAG: hypothetical protein LBI54_08255 [Lachnospiraceae bacterium]|nr:hypothetical protein [Lachnospiraceae bacterium]
MKTRKTSTRTLMALVVGLSVLLAYLPTHGFSLLSKAAEANPDTPIISEGEETPTSAETPATDEAEETATDTPTSSEPSDENEIEADEHADTEPNDTEEAVAEDIDEAKLDEQSEDLQVNISFAAASGGREVEDNGTPETATVMDGIGQDNPITGSMSGSGDLDYYKFTLTEAGRVNLSLSHTGGSISSNSGWNLYVYYYETNSEIMSLQTEWSAGSANRTSRNAYLPAGDYYIKINGYGYINSNNITNVDYTLRVLFDKNTGQYETESNSSRETANNIDLNTEVTGNLDIYTEMDYYEIVLTEAGRLNIKFAEDSSSSSSNFEYWEITMLPELESEKLYSFVVSRGGTVATSPHLYWAAGTYFVRVEGRGGGGVGSRLNGIDYHLTALFEPGNGRFEVEANDTVATATQINGRQTPITGYLATINDVDYYKFTVSKAGNFYLRFIHPETDTRRGWKVSLYKSTEVPGVRGDLVSSIEATGTKATNDTNAAYLEPGVYYVLVNVRPGGNTYYSATDYTFSVRSDDGGEVSTNGQTQYILLEIVNWYDGGSTEGSESVTIKAATYDGEGALISILSGTIPEGTKKVRLMIWGGEDDKMTPFTEAQEWRY